MLDEATLQFLKGRANNNRRQGSVQSLWRKQVLGGGDERVRPARNECSDFALDLAKHSLSIPRDMYIYVQYMRSTKSIRGLIESITSNLVCIRYYLSGSSLILQIPKSKESFQANGHVEFSSAALPLCLLSYFFILPSTSTSHLKTYVITVSMWKVPLCPHLPLS
jgi:hypothetical protein